MSSKIRISLRLNPNHAADPMKAQMDRNIIDVINLLRRKHLEQIGKPLDVDEAVHYMCSQYVMGLVETNKRMAKEASEQSKEQNETQSGNTDVGTDVSDSRTSEVSSTQSNTQSDV